MTMTCPSCGEEQYPESGAEACPSCGASWVLCGRYRLIDELGRGGMSVVYAARDTETGDEVAAKILSVAAATDGDWKGYELFERSSRVLRELDHPGLPRVFAFEQDDAGAFVLVRERFEGGTLYERIAEERRVLDGEKLAGLFEKLSEIVEFLQLQDPPIIHRDIKPSNIMFRTEEDWEPVLVDFDTIAKPTGGGMTLVGTPGYSAPEQLMGETSEASDVFSLGATLLFAATHVEPEKLERREGRYVLEGRLQNVDPAWRPVLEGMVEPAIEERFPTARDALRAVLEERARLVSPLSSSPGRRVWLIAAAVIAVGLAAWFITSGGEEEKEAAGPAAEAASEEVSGPALEAAGVLVGFESYPKALHISDEGRYICAGDADGVVMVWERKNNYDKVLWRKQLPNRISGLDIDLTRMLVAVVDTHYVEPNAGGVHVYALSTGELIWEAPIQASPGATVQFAPALSYLLTDNYGDVIRVYDMATGMELSKQNAPHGERPPAHFVVRGERLVSAGYDDQVHVMQLGPGPWERIMSIPGPEASFRGLDASADGSVVAAVDKEGGAWLWSIEEERRLHHLPKAHLDKPNGVALSPDGSRMVTVSDDLTVKLWDVERGEALLSMEPHETGKVYSVDWADAGPWLITGGRDKKVRLWKVHP